MKPEVSDHGAVDVAPGVRIPLSEIEFHAITGSGPGGQHVNRSATRIVLRWNIRNTAALNPQQVAHATTRLGTRVDSDGWIRIVSGEFRSQLQNRRAALERFASMMTRALVVPRQRKATKPTRASVERRLQEKKRRSDTKRNRRDFDS